VENLKTNSSLLGGFGLALLGTTCCALPVALVSLGMGGAVASMASAVPMLAWLPKYKALTFSLTALVLAYSGWRLRGVSQSSQCSLEGGKRLKWQKRLLAGSTAIFALAVFAAYALLPIALWLEA
jgi:membrane protein implicated in regulation of membrane protease activity